MFVERDENRSGFYLPGAKPASCLDGVINHCREVPRPLALNPLVIPVSALCAPMQEPPQSLHLSNPQGGLHVGHPVVEAGNDMIVWPDLTAIAVEFDLIRISNNRTAFSGRDMLVGEKGITRIIGNRLDVEGFTSILYDCDLPVCRDIHYPFHVGTRAVKVDRDDRGGVVSGPYSVRRECPCFGVNVPEDRLRADGQHHASSSSESKIRHNDAVAPAHTGGEKSKMQSGSPTAAHQSRRTKIFSQDSLELFNIFPSR